MWFCLLVVRSWHGFSQMGPGGLSPAAAGALAADYFKGGLGHSGTVRPGSKWWQLSSVLRPSHLSWQRGDGGVAETAWGPQPLPGPVQIERWPTDSPPLCRAPAKLFTSVASVPTLSPGGDYPLFLIIQSSRSWHEKSFPSYTLEGGAENITVNLIWTA